MSISICTYGYTHIYTYVYNIIYIYTWREGERDREIEREFAKYMWEIAPEKGLENYLGNVCRRSHTQALTLVSLVLPISYCTTPLKNNCIVMRLNMITYYRIIKLLFNLLQFSLQLSDNLVQSPPPTQCPKHVQKTWPTILQTCSTKLPKSPQHIPEHFKTPSLLKG